ncbi:TonB-dependent receptor [Shewanella sp. MF05960]|uniref:TonB-dependent receptor n=1 Tax=Shewanella sp. MF05960 TaxID=3434874 RepID=UPI003D7B157E
MTTYIKKIKIIGTVMAIPFALSSIAQAIAAESNGAQKEQTEIEVITVTSEKRVSTLQETPIAISAFNANELARQDIEEPNDIQFAIPNAMFTDRGTYNIRGVGNNAIGASAESGTGVHVNGIYLTAPSASNEFYDLQTIEVLRGPQGTLYGRNTTAGVVNMITQRPTEDFEASINVEVGNYNSLRTVGMVNIPISDNIKQRFAFNTVKRDGFTENIATGNDIDGRDQFSVRSTTAFQLSDALDATLFAQYYKEDSNRSNRRGVRCISDPILGCASDKTGFEFVDSDYLDGNLKAALGASAAIVRSDFFNTNPDGSIKINPNDPHKVNLDNDPIAIADDLLVSFELNYVIDSGIFTSVTAYHDRDNAGQRDYDNANGSNAFLIPVNYVFNDDVVLQGTRNYEAVQVLEATSKQYSQEFRFVSDLDANFNYTAGVYWLNYESDSRVATFVPYLSLLASALRLPNEFHEFDTRTPELDTSSWAIFGETYFDLTEKLKLTTGIRYSNEEKSQSTQTVSPLSFLQPGFDPTAFEYLENDWQETTGKIGLSYDADISFTDDTLFFGTLARGYKAGGLNPGGASKKAFDAEYINSIEFGTKNTMLDRRLQANVTVFYYDYSDIQLGALEQGGTGAAITDNTDAKVSGAEFEFVAMPIADLMFNLNVALLDSEITGTFSTPDGSLGRTAIAPDVKGNSLPYAPESSIQFGVQYTHGIFNDLEITYLAQTYWQDDFYARVYNTSTDNIDSWNQTDFTVSISDTYKLWEVEAFVKNVSNNDSVTGLSVENSLTGRFRLPAILDPIQYGVRFQYRFE